MAANAHTLFNMNANRNEIFEQKISFDLIIVDEGSQYPIDQFLAPLQFIHNEEVTVSDTGTNLISTDKTKNQRIIKNLALQSRIDENHLEEYTKIVIVGDQNQLPPVQVIKPPLEIKPILDNLFSYYFDYHNIHNNQLLKNYRSHKNIIRYTNSLELYEPISAFRKNRYEIIKEDISTLDAWNDKDITTEIDDWVKTVLDPSKINCSIIHQQDFEKAASELEAYLVTEILTGYYIMSFPEYPKDIPEDEVKECIEAETYFWEKKIGIISPHNAQSRLIIRQVIGRIKNYNLNHLKEEDFMQLLEKTIFSVEKFQGSTRELIIASFGVSAIDQLRGEEEFIYDLNRFNVLTSRAKYKNIIIWSQNFIDYVPNDQLVMKSAFKIKNYNDLICKNVEIFEFIFKGEPKKIQLRYLAEGD